MILTNLSAFFVALHKSLRLFEHNGFLILTEAVCLGDNTHQLLSLE